MEEGGEEYDEALNGNLGGKVWAEIVQLRSKVDRIAEWVDSQQRKRPGAGKHKARIVGRDRKESGKTSDGNVGKKA